MSAEIVREQIEVLAKSFPIAAIKTGLLYSAEIIAAVARAIVRLTRKSGRRGDTDSPWRGRQRFHTRRDQGYRQLRQFIDRPDTFACE